MLSLQNHVTQYPTFVSAPYPSILFYLPSSELFPHLAHAPNIFSVQNLLFHRLISTKFPSHVNQHLFSLHMISVHFILSQTHKYTHMTIIFTSQIFFSPKPSFQDHVSSHTHTVHYLSKKYTTLATVHIHTDYLQMFHIIVILQPI